MSFGPPTRMLVARRKCVALRLPNRLRVTGKHVEQARWCLAVVVSAMPRCADRRVR